MKRLSLVLTILVTLLHAHLHAATFTASQIEITPGQTAQLVIGMNNTETNLSGFQFKLYLPEGLSVTTNANGQFVYTQSGRIANHDVNFRVLDDGSYLVVVYSMDANVITGSSGELMSISVTADWTASTSGNSTLSNIRITDVSSITSSCSDVPIDVTILKAHPHDATLTASKIEITPGQTAPLVIGMNNTDTNLSGFQFKLYLPEGLSVTTNTNGQFVYTQSERIANHTVNIRALDDGGYLVVVYSMDANVITGSSGELMSISVTADETASTSGNGRLSNIRITDVSSSTSSCNDVTIDVTIVPKFHYVTFKYGETVYLHEQVAYGAVVPVPEDPMLKGHTFAGWSPDVPETMPDSDLVFTALFTVNQYTVTFTIPSEEWTKEFTLDYGAAITVPDVPQKPGYTFAGWDKPVPETMPDSAIVFTGSYTQNLQILTLTASGNGSVSYGETNVRSASQNFNVGELSQVILTITPDTGHHIASLLLNGENALLLLTEDGKLTIESMTASASVSVTFAPNVHDVTFRYGETIYQQTQVAYGEIITVPDDPKLKGHTFAGWDKPVPETMPDSALVFTALFTVNQYTVTFTIPSEEWTKEFTLDYGAAITVPDVPQKPGYTFAGWDKPVPETMPDADLVFTGSYTQNSLTLSLTATGNGTVQYGNTSVRSSSQSFDVAELSDVVLTITPDAGHHVETLTINGEDALSQMTDGKLSIGSMTASVIVAVTFAANVIDFADAGVKALCVANWDTNGDGELDEAEAAAVTDIGTVFHDNQTITSFDELQYFTGLTNIGKYAFEHCHSLTSVIIPNSVVSIGESAFYYCESLTSITIPNSVISIGEYAFFVCDGLTSVTIPQSVNSIDGSAFGGCDGLTSIKVETGNTKYDSRNDCNAIIETATNTLITGCQNTVIPNSVTRIGKVAFYGCNGLTSVTIPNSVTSISYFAFFGCDGLTSLTIPESVKSVESSAVVGCSGLTSIKVETGNTKYDSRNDCNAIIETASNKLITGCQNTVIPNSVTAIDQNAFNGCSSLTSITIPESVTSIGYSAFKECSSMTSLTIPNSVTSIDISVFWGCSGLASVTIPESVTSIGENAFGSCSNLTNITSYIKEPFAISDNVFNGIPYETATLFVPAGSVDAYKATDGWKNFQNIEAILQQLTIAVVGDGTVTFLDEALTNTTATFKVGGEVKLQLTPDEGCHIERVMVNQQDCTSQVTDGVLTLNVIDEDFFVLAEFQHNAVEEPDSVTYTIYIDGFGDVRVKDETLNNSEQTIRVPQGSDLVLEFLPDEGQMVDKVTWNGETVTEQVLGNTFVVRNVQEDGTVSVIFMEQIETFEYAGIRYGVTDNTQRTLKVLPYDYSGHLSIPASFEHSQRTWQVQEIGNLAFANCEWLVSVKIPSSISKTGKNLFKRDARLAAIQWDALLPLRTEVTGELTNANMLYYVKDKSYAPQNGNVIVDGMADNIILSDGHDFYCPEAFKAKRVAYNHIYKMLTRRGHCQGWETLVLPFDVETVRLSRNPDNPEIYPYKSLTDDDKVERGETLPFWLYSYGDDDTFTPAASIEANMPYIISMPNDVAYLPMFRLAGNVTFSAQDDSGVDVYCTNDGNLKAPGSHRRFQPSFQRQVMGNDCYLVNVNDSINHQFAEGSKFIQALRPARPFEAYMISQTASVKPWYDIFEQIPTEIRDLPVRDEEQGRERVYDLSGREVSGERTANGRLPKGIYIINGKKQIMK